MDWNICVVSDREEQIERDLNNALLYGSRVEWIPTNLARYARGIVLGFLLIASKSKIEIDKIYTEIDSVDQMIEHFVYLLRNDNENDSASALDFINKCNIKRRKAISTGFDIDIPEFIQVAYPKLIAEAGVSRNDQVANETFAAADRELKKQIDQAIKQSDASLVFDEQFEVRSPQKFDSRVAANELMNAMQRVLLPDVSALCLEQVKALQDRSKDELEPMRAEMLRLTEDLRKMVGDDGDMNDLAREAENLIATRVEPSVRELNSRIKSDGKQFGWSMLAHPMHRPCDIGGGFYGTKLVSALGCALICG